MVNGQLKEIQKKYGNDRTRYNQEVQKFYSENNISPMSGCGWSLIPLIILWPLYAIIRRPLRFMMWLPDTAITAVAEALGFADFAIGGYDEMTLAAMINSENIATASAAAGSSRIFEINFHFLGLDLSNIPSFRFWSGGLSAAAFGLFLLPIISAILSLLSMIVSQKTNQISQSQQQSNNWMMMIISPLISLWIGYSLPAGMCIYWISNSILAMLQEVICKRILQKSYDEAEKEMQEQLQKSKELEKEKRRAAAEKKAEAYATASPGKKIKKVQPQAKNKGIDLSASREGMRPYARGRAYDPNRYPITPYSDPDEKYKKNKKQGQENEEISNDPLPLGGTVLETDELVKSEEYSAERYESVENPDITIIEQKELPKK